MTAGLLWLDDNRDRDLEDRINEAAIRHHQRFGHWPDTCDVADAGLPETVAVNGCTIQLRVVDNLPPHHWFLWRKS